MARPKKDGKFLNVYIEKSVYDDLQKYADQVGQTKTKAIEIIIEKYLKDNQSLRKNQITS